MSEEFNWPIFTAMVLILIIGLLNIYSASYNDESVKFFRQGLFVITGGISFFLLALKLNYMLLAKFAYAIYFAVILLLLILLYLPTELSVRRWISIPFVGISIQPSEFMKIGLVVVLARYLMYRKNYRTLKGLILPFLITMLPMLLVLKQPDLGTAMLFLPILFAMLFVAAARVKHLAGIIIVSLICAVPVYMYVLKDYQKERLILWGNQIIPIRQEKDMRDYGYQLLESRLAIGSGGIFGKGFLNGKHHMDKYVPLSETDFIFSVVGEEWGFAGCTVLVLLYFFIFLCGLGVASRTREPFGRLLTVGIVVMLAAQAFINMAMTIGLMPVTGVTLPLISYGGSSLITSIIGIALIINVGRARLLVVADEDFKD